MAPDPSRPEQNRPTVSRLRNRLQARWRLLWFRQLVRVLALAAVVVGVLGPLPAWLTRHPSHGLTAAERLKATNDVRTTLIQGLGGLVLLGGLFYTSRTFRLTREGQLTDRYTKAIEQLGSTGLDVRLDGIYAWSASPATPSETTRRSSRSLVPSSGKSNPLYQYIQAGKPGWQGSPDKPDKNELQRSADTYVGGLERPPVDVQAAAVLGRLPARYSEKQRVPREDLNGAQLAGAVPREANLAGADLRGAKNPSAAKELTQQQLDSALGDDKTTLPAGLRQPAHWSAGPVTPPAANR